MYSTPPHTTFRGKRVFHTRLEALWSDRFSAAHFKPKYEPFGPKTFPDFFLRRAWIRGLPSCPDCNGVFVEVKPADCDEPTRARMEGKARGLVLKTGTAVMVFIGDQRFDDSRSSLWMRAEDGSVALSDEHSWNGLLKMLKVADRPTKVPKVRK